MSIDNGEKITQLLAQFNMTGKQLAEALHVHHSLVSKWRNRERALSSRSPIFKELIEYFLTLDKPKNYITLKTIIAARFPDARMQSRQEVYHWLVRWLTDKETAADAAELESLAIKGALKGSFYIYSGIEGRAESSSIFMDMALEEPRKSERILFSQEDYNWFYNDDEYSARWQQRNQEYTDRGGITKKIHTVDQSSNWIATSLFNWIPSYLHNHAFSAYLPRYINSAHKMSVNILKDKLIQFSLSADGSPGGTYTFLSRDPILNKSVWPVLEAMFDECIPLFERLSPGSNPDHRQQLDRAIQREENSFHFSTFPPFALLGDERVERILRLNNVDSRTAEGVLEKCRAIRERHGHPLDKKFRFIYDIQRLEQLLKEDRIVVHELSSLTSHPIFISPELYRICLREMLDAWDALPNHEIALHPIKLFQVGRDITLWVKENAIATATTVVLSQMKVVVLALQEVTSVNALYHYILRLWDEIPAQERDRAWVREQLLHALDDG